MRPPEMPEPSASKPATLISFCDGWVTITTSRVEDLKALRAEFGPHASRNATLGTWTWALPEAEVEITPGPVPRRRSVP